MLKFKYLIFGLAIIKAAVFPSSSFARYCEFPNYCDPDFRYEEGYCTSDGDMVLIYCGLHNNGYYHCFESIHGGGCLAD